MKEYALFKVTALVLQFYKSDSVAIPADNSWHWQLTRCSPCVSTISFQWLQLTWFHTFLKTSEMQTANRSCSFQTKIWHSESFTSRQNVSKMRKAQIVTSSLLFVYPTRAPVFPTCLHAIPVQQFVRSKLAIEHYIYAKNTGLQTFVYASK